MKQLTKNNKMILKRKLVNLTIILIFSILIITTYYTANHSKAEEIPEISVRIKNSLQLDEIAEYTVNATSSSDGTAYYIKLPEYINNNRVIKYSYYIEEITEDETTTEEGSTTEEGTVEEETTEDTTTEEETTNVNEIGPNDVLPESQIYLTSSEVENREITIIAHYDTKQIGEKLYYNKKLEYIEGTAQITVTGYMPQVASLIVEEQDDIKTIQTKIRKHEIKPIMINSAYDITIQAGEIIYQPYEVEESVKVSLVKEELVNKQTNIWHIKADGTIEMLQYEEETTEVETTQFSIYAIEDVDDTQLAIDSMAERVFTVDDMKSDKDYWIGRNYTDDISGEYTGTYTDETLASVTINYYSFAKDEVEPEMVGFVSLTERYNVLTYKKTCPITSGKVTIELIDNPFCDRPEGFGFGGWVSSDGNITKDSKTDVQSINATASSNMTLNIYTNWIKATVVYVNGAKGNDNVNNGLSPESPFGSWGKALSYLRSNSTNRNDRERNIVVMTGNMNTSINYTTPKTYANKFTSSTTFTPGKTYIISNGTGAGANAFTAYDNTKSNTVLSATTVPHLATQWKIEASGNGYTLQNAYTGLYFSYEGAKPSCLKEPYIWQYNSSKRGFYTPYNGVDRYIGWYTDSDPDMWTTAPISYVQSCYFLTYSSSNTSGSTASNSSYTSSTNVAFTLTGLYNHKDYRNNAKLTLATDSSYIHFSIYNDFQIEYIDINASGYTSFGVDSTTDTSYPVLYRKCS